MALDSYNGSAPNARIDVAATRDGIAHNEGVYTLQAVVQCQNGPSKERAEYALSTPLTLVYDTQPPRLLTDMNVLRASPYEAGAVLTLSYSEELLCALPYTFQVQLLQQNADGSRELLYDSWSTRPESALPVHCTGAHVTFPLPAALAQHVALPATLLITVAAMRDLALNEDTSNTTIPIRVVKAAAAVQALSADGGPGDGGVVPPSDKWYYPPPAVLSELISATHAPLPSLPPLAASTDSAQPAIAIASETPKPTAAATAVASSVGAPPPPSASATPAAAAADAGSRRRLLGDSGKGRPGAVLEKLQALMGEEDSAEEDEEA